MSGELALCVAFGAVCLFDICFVLRDIRSALQGIAGDGYLRHGKLDELTDKLGDMGNALETMAGYANNRDWKLDGVVDELNRIGYVLGGILASMPSPPPEPEARSDWDRLRAQLGASGGQRAVSGEGKGELGSFRVMDRRGFAADGPSNASADWKLGAK